MKPIVCVSSEGRDTKIVVLSKEKDTVKLHQTFSMVMSGGETFNDPLSSDSSEDSLKGFETDFNIESVGEGESNLASVEKNDISFAANNFDKDILNKADFIPVVTDPIVNHHNYSGHISPSKKKNIDKHE